ncbi:hypothetical protein B0H13DRAFT_2333115 [Mycena leptocephala]|nr:hypothetical protein B0H13DRAFT_2333115 [Mycena leptocephala]
MEPGKADDTSACTGSRSSSTGSVLLFSLLYANKSGIAGGVVSQPFFRSHFGLLDASGYPITSKTNAISSKLARSSAASISAIIDHRVQTHSPLRRACVLVGAQSQGGVPDYGRGAVMIGYFINCARVPWFFVFSSLLHSSVLFLVLPSADSR